MAQTKIKATAQLFLDTSNAEGDAKKFVDDLKKKLISIETAADKMTVFKDMVGYIGQVDQALAELQANNKDVFDHMFDGIGADLKKVMESIFGATSENMSALEQLKAKVAAAKANPATTGDDLKPLEKEVRSLYKSLGMSGKSGIFGKGKVETRLANLEASLKNFGVVFENVQNKIKGGFKLGETGVGASNDAIQGEIDKLQKQVKQYQALQKQLQHLAEENTKFANNETLSDEFSTEKTGRAVLELIKLWEKLNAERKKIVDSGDTSSIGYHENLSKMTETALKLQKLQSDLSQKAQDKLHTVAVGKSTLGEMFDNAYLNAEDFLKGATDELNNIPKTIGKIVAETESKMTELKSALKPASTEGVGDVGDVVSQNKKAVDSYTQLISKVKEYIEVQKQLQSLSKGTAAYKDALARRGQLQLDVLGMKDLDDDQENSVADIFEEMNTGAISSADAVSKLCGILQIDIPGGLSDVAQSAASGFNAITKGADNASKAIQKVMYHLGNLLNGKGKKQDTFDEMPFNLTEAVQGNDKYEKYGFGVLGSGLFGVSDPSTISQDSIVSSKFIHGIDLSKYNMYMADTEERAAALMDFLSKLQKYAMKQAEPNYKGFDEQLAGVNMDTLYDQFKVVFNESDLTKEKLNNFLNDMVGLLHQAGLKFDEGLNELAFTSIGDLDGSENISTRFMKMLGYHGVNVGGTSFDGFGQGSVLFDFKDSDLVSYFNNVGQAVDDFNKRINEGSWDGTNEQLKQYRANIDDIIARLQEYEQKYQKPSITKNVNDTVAKLTQTKTVIDQLLSGVGDAGSGSLHVITADSDKIVQVTKAYDDVFDVLSKIENKWKDLDTVDSAIGSMSLSDIDMYVKELERLVKLIESLDSNFQHGDKDEYDGIVKTLEKMHALSARTKLTDEFKNTINQFEQLGKFQWSDELTNGYVKILEDIRNGTYKTIGQCVAKFNELSNAANKPTMDVATAFRELVKHISNSHSSPATIFDHLEGTTLKVSDNLKEILQALNLIDSKGKVNLTSLKTGFTNKGGFVSDKYTMIARPDYYLGKIQSIQPKLQQAQKEGAQIGAIFDIIEDKAKGLIYEIQNTVPGESVLGHHSGKTNADILNASAAHIDGLVNTLQILAKNGLFVDWGGDNVLYDPQKGFSIIDMGDKGGKHFTVSAQNTLQENLDRMVQEMFKYSSLDMQQALKDGMVKNLYASAQKLDSAVINPYAPKQTQAAKSAQAASTKTASAVQSESDAHDQNAASIKAENEALQAQIELKKKAQSMKWEAFAVDDSLSALKQSAGMQTLGQLEGFWKKANYEKQINFHEITDTEAKQIFKDKLPKGLASKWYSSADFLSKSQLENEILADDEIRNAAMSYFWHIFKNSYSSKKYPNVKTFEDFLDTEMTMYRGDQAPLIYDPSSKLSFSINESTANGFNANLGTIKIKPKDTIGNAGSTFTSELETFAPSEQTSWFQKTREAFEDFYNNQTKEMQKEIDAGLVNFEKKRVSDIIGDDLSTLTHKALQSSYWKYNVANDLNQGVIPEQITVPTDSSDYAQFATAYNGLTDTMKRFVMFFASMDELSASLPKPFSISTQTTGGGFKYGKNAVGADAKLFNAILNDPDGRHQHLAKLTGEQSFNLMGQTPAAINAEADAHERNAQAVTAEAKAKKDLNSLQERYDHVMDDLWDSSVDADGSKHKDLSKLWSQLYDVQHSEQDLVDQGMYTQKSTGDDIQATDLFQLVVDIEQKYNENLDYVKDYLKQVYSNIDFGNITPALMSPTQADFDATKTKTYETAKNAYKSGNQREYFKILSVLNHLNDVEAADAEDIAKAQYTDTDTGRRYDVSKLIGMVKSIEDAYGENFDYVYAYLKKVYGDATIDDALSNLPSDDAGARRDTGSQYTVEDYEKIYAASPADMQAAIDDLAVFQQRYEQLYALTNTQPIEIMFPGKPTLDEVDQVIAAFEEFKSKQRQIFQLQMLDYEGNKDKIQELQAEAVGLQNKLRDAALGEDADLAEYKLTYGFMDDQDADRFKNLVEMTESVHTVMNDLTRIGEHKMSLIPPEMQDMLEYESGDTAERFMALHAQQVQSAKAAAQQADASAAAAKQQLQTEQDITSEKQRQASLTDQQVAQTPSDAAQTQAVQTEAVAMGTLLQQVEAVKAAVIAKTDAFTAEGVAVEETVNKEIAALTQLKTLLDGIQNSLQLIFAANSWNLGDVNLSQDKTSSNAMPNVLGEIKSILGQIYGVLSKSTGVESDNKNSANYKAPVVDTKTQESDAYKYLADKLPKDAATESTLSAILAAVNQLVKIPKDSGNTDLTNLSAAIIAASTELKGVANGIVQQQKAAKSDTSVAQARITKKDSYVQIKSAALGALGDRALDSEVTEMQALSNGVVKVTGWLKVAEDAWEGFTVKVNEAGVASGLAIEKNTKAAKQAAAQAEQMKLYSQAAANQVQKPKVSYGINKNAYGATSVSTIQGKFNALSSQAQQYSASGWGDIAVAYQKAETALQNLITLQSQFQGKKMPDNHSQFVQYRDACNAANKELKKLIESADEFRKKAAEDSIRNVHGDIDVKDRDSRAEALKAYVQDMYGGKAVIRGFNADMTELQFTIKNTDNTTTDMTAAFNSAKTQIGALQGETKKTVSTFDLLGSKFKELWRYALARMGVDDVIRAVRQGVESVREIDAALTELKKVTNETDGTYDRFLQTMSQTGSKVGSSVSELTQMAAEWSRLGYNLEEAGMLAESTAILLNVSEFDDATTASEALISTMQAFGYAADESDHVVDILNEVKVTCLLV